MGLLQEAGDSLRSIHGDYLVGRDVLEGGDGGSEGGGGGGLAGTLLLLGSPYGPRRRRAENF